MTEAPIRTLSKFEGRLTNLARAAVRLAPPESAAPFLADKLAAPPGLTPQCVELVCSALAQGSVAYLSRLGWQDERFLRDGAPVGGRLWRRWPLAERKLSFSRFAIEFLVALTSGGALPSRPIDEQSRADQWLVFLVYDAFRQSEAAVFWRDRPVFVSNPLCRLAWPEDFARQDRKAISFDGWSAGLGAVILEALHDRLAERWLTAQRGLRLIGDPDTLREAAENMTTTVDRYLDAIAVSRRDLAGWLLRAATRYCQAGVQVSHVVGPLPTAGMRLAERYALLRSAAVLPAALERLARWEQEARSVSFLDEGYAPAQFFLGLWEEQGAGPALAVARRLLRETDPLQAAAPQENADEPRLPRSRQRD